MAAKKTVKKPRAAHPDAGKLIFVGLGNPDPSYAKTYHNAGQEALRYMLARLGTESSEDGSGHGFIFTKLNNPRWVFVTPQTYMNESGLAAKNALRMFNARPEALVVLHDDSDIALGNYKLSFGSRAAGHKGAQSIIDTLGTQSFWRLRIGVRPEKEVRKAREFVLKKMRPADNTALKTVFEKIVRTLRTW